MKRIEHIFSGMWLEHVEDTERLGACPVEPTLRRTLAPNCPRKVQTCTIFEFIVHVISTLYPRCKPVLHGIPPSYRFSGYEKLWGMHGIDGLRLQHENHIKPFPPDHASLTVNSFEDAKGLCNKHLDMYHWQSKWLRCLAIYHNYTGSCCGQTALR